MNETSRGSFPREPSSGRASRRARAAALGLSLLVLVSLVPLAYGTLSALLHGDLQTLFFYLIFLLLPANLGLVGAVLAVRRPANSVGWLLLLAGALAGISFGGGEYERFAIAAGRTDWPLYVPAAWVASAWFIPAIGILVVFLPLVYPTGHLLSRRWRLVVAVGIFGVTAGALGSALAPGPMGDPRGPLNPLVPPAPVLMVVQAVATVSNLVAPPAFIAALGSLLLRFRRSGGIERQQIKWFLFVAAIATLAFAVSVLQVGPISDLGWALGILTMGFMPLAIGLAILRYGLYEIDRIVNRTLVYGAVTAILAGVFAAATALSQRLFIEAAGRSSDIAIVLTTLVVVAIYAPVRKRVEAVVDRYFKYDQREYGPYLDDLRRHLELVEPRRAAGRLAREAMKHTGATGVAVAGRSGAVVASVGAWPVEPVIAVPIGVGEAGLATILLGPRRDGKPHAPARIAALAGVATVAVDAIDSRRSARAEPGPGPAPEAPTPSEAGP